MVPVFDLLIMLIADIQLIGHLLQRISVLLTKNLHSLSTFPALSAEQEKTSSPYEADRYAVPVSRAKEKAPSKSNH